ncbi:hypothetical protein M5K25_012473 [Dendrobium thyrsiflorum]|uniref:HAT C-terminal dimerisation domain-containing protein n=1 Tax=Dendrobium thyrsiflorum TaxID=117978 RepID=A0ABD0UXJ7_DENTH
MLERLGQLPQHKSVILNAKFVSSFAITLGFATAYLTLQRFKELSINYALKTTKLLVKVLRMIDGERVTTIGFMYEVMNKAKEYIAKDLGSQESDYKEIWQIIDEKWDRQLHQHLYAAAYYLNPQFHYDKDFHVNKEIKTGLYAYMDKLVSKGDYLKVNDQFEDFHLKKGIFGFRAAQACYKIRSADMFIFHTSIYIHNIHFHFHVERWWAQFGDDVPELKTFAVKVLSLTCSAAACERNWSTFNQFIQKEEIDWLQDK